MQTPNPNDLINITVVYDPSANTVAAYATDLNTGQTASASVSLNGYFAPPQPGRYVFGIGAATGGCYANWAVLAASFSQGGARPSTDVYIAASTPTRTPYVLAPSAAVWTSTPSVSAGAAYYVPTPGSNTIYVGPQVLASVPSWSTLSISPTAATTAMLYMGGWRLPLYGGYTAYFAPSASATVGTTPNGLGIYWLSSNSTSYTAPSTPHSSTLTIPAIDSGVYVGASLGNWWNASRTLYTASLTAIGGPPPYSVSFGGMQNPRVWNAAWDSQNPPSTPVYMTGADGKTYAFVPSWAQQLGLSKILAAGAPALYVWGRPISQSSLAFVSGGVWLNYTQASGPYAYFPYFGTPGSMTVYANSTSTAVGSWALQIVTEGLSPTSASSANVTAWMYNGALSGSFLFSRPFSYLAFPAGGSLGPLWLLLNSTIGVPPYVVQQFPSTTQLVVSRGGYTAVNTYVSVPSQLFNQWSGNLVFAAAQMSPSGSYALMSGGFYSSPPTSFTIMLPTKSIGQLAYFLMASWPSGSTCSLLQQVSSPLDLTICQGAAVQSIAINLGTATVSSPTSFAGLAGAWTGLAGRIAPTSAILANAGVAALVILMIRRGRSLTAGLMTAGALVTALGLSLWLTWMIGEGAVMFVIASAVAFTRR
jgi:hypothetical protein